MRCGPAVEVVEHVGARSGPGSVRPRLMGMVMAVAAVGAVLVGAPQVVAAAYSPNAVPHKQLMIPGPIEFHEDVLLAAGGPAVGHTDPGFIQQFGDVLRMLRQVFLTESGQAFVVSGSGSLGWDLVGSSLVEPGENVLVINTGVFGDRFAESLEVYGGVVTHVRCGAVGGAMPLSAIRAALAAHPPSHFKMVTVTHVDTSTGVLMDVQAISALVRTMAPEALLVVDGVCSAGAERLEVDAWGVDAVITASQKALGVPPGLAVLHVSDRALQALSRRAAPPTSYFASLSRWLPIMRAYEEGRAAYFATPAVQLVQALHVSLRQMLQQTPDIRDRFAAHVGVSDAVKAAVRSWGLALLTDELREQGGEGGDLGSPAHTMTAVMVPEGLGLAQILSGVSARGVMVAGGLHPMKSTQYFRIGHMGLSVMEPQRGHIDNVLQAIRGSLADAGYRFPNGSAQEL